MEALERHAFDASEHAREVVALGRLQGSDAEAAVAADDASDTMQRGRAQGLVPEQLRVVVGVNIHETRRDNFAGSVDSFRRLLGDSTDADNAPVSNADVAFDARFSGAIDDGSARDF